MVCVAAMIAILMTHGTYVYVSAALSAHVDEFTFPVALDGKNIGELTVHKGKAEADVKKFCYDKMLDDAACAKLRKAVLPRFAPERHAAFERQQAEEEAAALKRAREAAAERARRIAEREEAAAAARRKWEAEVAWQESNEPVVILQRTSSRLNALLFTATAWLFIPAYLLCAIS